MAHHLVVDRVDPDGTEHLGQIALPDFDQPRYPGRPRWERAPHLPRQERMRRTAQVARSSVPALPTMSTHHATLAANQWMRRFQTGPSAGASYDKDARQAPVSTRVSQGLIAPVARPAGAPMTHLVQQRTANDIRLAPLVAQHALPAVREPTTEHRSGNFVTRTFGQWVPFLANVHARNQPDDRLVGRAAAEPYWQGATGGALLRDPHVGFGDDTQRLLPEGDQGTFRVDANRLRLTGGTGVRNPRADRLRTGDDTDRVTFRARTGGRLNLKTVPTFVQREPHLNHRATDAQPHFVPHLDRGVQHDLSAGPQVTPRMGVPQQGSLVPETGARLQPRSYLGTGDASMAPSLSRAVKLERVRDTARTSAMRQRYETRPDNYGLSPLQSWAPQEAPIHEKTRGERAVWSVPAVRVHN